MTGPQLHAPDHHEEPPNASGPTAAHHHGHAGHRGGGADHDKHAGHSPAMFRDRFWLPLLLILPVVYWSEHVQELLGYRALTVAATVDIGIASGTVVVAGVAHLLRRESLGVDDAGRQT